MAPPPVASAVQLGELAMAVLLSPCWRWRAWRAMADCLPAVAELADGGVVVAGDSEGGAVVAGGGGDVVVAAVGVGEAVVAGGGGGAVLAEPGDRAAIDAAGDGGLVGAFRGGAAVSALAVAVLPLPRAALAKLRSPDGGGGVATTYAGEGDAVVSARHGPGCADHRRRSPRWRCCSRRGRWPRCRARPRRASGGAHLYPHRASMDTHRSCAARPGRRQGDEQARAGEREGARQLAAGGFGSC